MVSAPMALAFAAGDETENKQDDNGQQRIALALELEAGRKLDAASGRAERKLIALREIRAEQRRRAERRKQLRRETRLANAPSTASPQLQSIAACESGGNPAAIGGGGAYRGKYQFDYGTWASVGGSGDPAAAPEAEQDARAATLLARTGGSAWPNCA